MSAYAGPWRVVSAEPVPAPLLALARKLVGGLIEVGGIPQRQWNLPDGSTIHVLLVAGVPKVTITQPQGAPATAAALFKLWLPRGFVAVPASSSYPRGAGLPVVPSTEQPDPYAKANLEPGLDMARWTAGGPHGQVLLSTDADGGFPTAIAQGVPLYYGTLGPTDPQGEGFDSRATGAVWHAFRPRYADFVQHYDADPSGPRRALFAALNAYRDTNAVAAAYLMPRGFYRPAEVLSYLLTANGTRQASYPAGYRSTDQRLLKDGPWTDAAAGYNELVATGGAPGDVLTAWQASHAAALLLQPAHAPVFADVGFSGGQWALTTQVREQWIMAGRRSFESADTALPPISWDGPPALNLGWTTFPITFHNRAIWAPAPLVVDGRFWLSYACSTHGSRPAIGPNVYCRGRVLGALPDGGLVLGAGLAVIEKSDQQPAVDRLLVIAHHPADNAALDMATQGLMAVARVWYADFPRSAALRLHAEAPVTDVLDPDAPPPGAGTVRWSDGGTLPLPGLKYESLWAFAADGSKACCLRDAVSVSEILDYFTTTYPGGNGYGWYSGAFKGVLCEVAVTAQPAISLSTTALATKSYLARGQADQYNYRPSLYPSNPPGTPADAWAAEDQLVPLVAGYVDGAVRIAYHGFASLLDNATDPRVYPPALGGDGKCWYAAFGGTALVYPSQSDSAVVLAQGMLGSNDGYAWPAAPVPLIADLAQQAVIADLDTTATKLAGYTRAGDRYTYTYAANAAFKTDVLNTTQAVRRVRVYQRGRLLHEAAYPHPYGVLWGTDRVFLPDVDGSGAFTASLLDPSHPFDPDTDAWAVFPPAPDLTLQPVFAQRGEDHVVGYQIGLAMPLTTLAFGSLTNPTMTDYAAARRINLTQTISAESRPVVGGWFATTFDAPDTGGEWLAEAMTC